MTGASRGEIIEALIAYPLQRRVVFHQRKRKFTASVVSAICTAASRDVMSVVKTPGFPTVTTLLAVSMLAGTALADPRASQTSERKQKVEEVTVFVTGSLIPQRVRLQPVGTTTASPVRIIDRREIDGTGRLTTAGALINDPSVRIVGFGH